jgi:hypothetical protein
MYAPFALKLDAHPEFMHQIIEELIDKQMVYYETVSEAAVDLAYDFFMSPAGVEWIQLASNFTLKLNDLVQGWAEDIMSRLKAL